MPVANCTEVLAAVFQVSIESIATVGRGTFHQAIYADDLNNVFFNTDEFAEQASYFHSSLGRWETYSVLFDDPYTSFGLGPETQLTNIRPQAMVSEDVLKHKPLKGDKFRIHGVDYFVDDSQKDGVGVITIFFRIN